MLSWSDVQGELKLGIDEKCSDETCKAKDGAGRESDGHWVSLRCELEIVADYDPSSDGICCGDMGLAEVARSGAAPAGDGRLILGVRRSTASSAVRGELGLWRVSARIQFAVLRWWGKLVSLPRERLAYRVYRWRKEHIRQNRPSFCAYVRDLLTNLQLRDVAQ